jgi:hypothetical protein
MHESDPLTSFEDSIEPSDGFVQRVMCAVRREARPPAPIPFPWRISAAGALLATVACALGSALNARGVDFVPRLSASMFRLDAPLGSVGAIGVAVALACLAVAAAADWYVARSE